MHSGEPRSPRFAGEAGQERPPETKEAPPEKEAQSEEEIPIIEEEEINVKDLPF